MQPSMRTLRLTDDVTFLRSSSPAETAVGSEVVLMTLASGQCFGLGETGSAVWRLLAQPTRLQAIVDALSSTYDAPVHVIEQDVRELLEEMLDRGLIELQ